MVLRDHLASHCPIQTAFERDNFVSAAKMRNRLVTRIPFVLTGPIDDHLACQCFCWTEQPFEVTIGNTLYSNMHPVWLCLI